MLTENAFCRWRKRTISLWRMIVAGKSSSNPDLPDTGLALVIDGATVPLPVVRQDEDGRRVANEINAYLDRVFGREGAMRIPVDARGVAPTCPQCQGVVEPAAVHVAEMRLDCPQCDETFSLVMDRCQPLPEDDHSTRTDAEAPAPRPADTAVVIEHPSPSEMLVYVPPKGLRGAAKGLFVFSCIWLGFMIVFTSVWVVAAGEEGGDRSFLDRYGPLLFCGLFWVIGIGMMAAALRAASEKVFVLIEPDRITLRTERFRKERTRAFPRAATADVCLEVAYSENDVPVHRIAFTEDAAKARFGTGLSEEEKRWLLGEIRRFMQSTSRGWVPPVRNESDN